MPDDSELPAGFEPVISDRLRTTLEEFRKDVERADLIIGKSFTPCDSLYAQSVVLTQLLRALFRV